MRPGNRRPWHRLLWLGCSFSLWLCHAAWAGSPTVTAIEVVGNKVVSTDSIKLSLQSRVGQPYSASQVASDIRTLFRRGEFADIRVERQSLSGGVKLIYHLTERPVITAIRFEGNKKIKDKTLLEKIPVRTYRALSGEELARAISTIQDLYEEKRFFLVDVDYRVEAGPEGSVLVFRIREHGKAAIRRIQFVGNRVFGDRALKKILRTKEKGAQLFRQGKYVRDRLEQDVALLMRHYLNHGYLRARVERPRVEISKDKRHLVLTFAITEGQRYRFADIRVEGDILTTREEVLAKIKSRRGELYRQDDVERDLMELVLFYGTMGYAFANIQPVPIPNDADGTAELVFMIAKGRRVWIDKINISGNTTTRDKVIRRELKVKEGDLFNRRLLEESREKLMQLGYFEGVEFATPRGSRPDSVNLNIIVKERPTGAFNIGAGFSTAENFFFTGSVQKQNFFGLGISGQIAAEVSKLRQQYVVQFSDPYFLDTEWILSLSSYRTFFRYPEFDRKAFGGSASLGHRIFENVSVNLGYSAESAEAQNFLFSVPEVFRLNASGLTSAVSLGMAYDTRDNRIFPRKGLYGSVNNEVSGTKLGGDNDFYRLNVQGRIYQPIAWGFVTKLYTKAGYINSLGTQPVPLYERYNLGGPNSLRGYDPWSVGPSLRLPNGPSGGDTRFVFGGNKMLQINWELEVPIYNPGGFKAVAFVDAGNAFAEEESIGLKNVRTNYGFGLRWISPLGPLRFEWGIPINKRAGEAGTVFNFTIGDFF